MLRGGDGGAGTAVPVDDTVTHPQQLATRAAVYKMGDCSVPTGVAVAEDGRVYVSELRANGISRFSWVGLTQNPVTGWSKETKVVTGTSRPAGLTYARVLGRDLLVGTAMRGNDAWWADVSGSGPISATPMGLDLLRPMGLCLSNVQDVTETVATAQLYVTDTRRDKLMKTSLTIGLTEDGALSMTSVGAATEVVAFAGHLDRPYDVQGRSPGSNELFVASAHNHAVFRADADGEAGSATEITALSNFQLGGAAAETMRFPTGLSTDGEVLYVVDQQHNRVLSYDLGGGADPVKLVSGSFPGGQNVLEDQDFDKMTAESYNRPFDCALASGGSSLVLTSGADNALVTVAVSLNPPKVQSVVVESGGGDHGTAQVCFTYKDHPRVAADTAEQLTFSAEVKVGGAVVGSASGQTTTQDSAVGFAGTVAVPLTAALSDSQTLSVTVQAQKGEQAAESAPLEVAGAASPASADERFVSYEDSTGTHRALRVDPSVDAVLPPDATLHFADLSWLTQADYRLKMVDANARSVAVPDAFKFFAEAAPTAGRRTLVGPRVDLDGVDLSAIADWSGGVSPVHVRGTPTALPASFTWVEHPSNGGKTLFSDQEGNALSYQHANLGDLSLPDTVRIEGKLNGAKTNGLTVTGSGLPPVTAGRKWVQKNGKATLLGAGVDLTNADLANSDFTGADLSGAVLDGANMSGATATSVAFEGASLARTNMQGADLGLASFTDASSVLLSGSETAPTGFTWLRKLGTDEFTLVDDALVSGGGSTQNGNQKEARKVRIQMRAHHSTTPQQGSLMWQLTRDLRVDSASRGFYLVDPDTFTWGNAFDTIVTDGLLLTGWTKEIVELLTIQSVSVAGTAAYNTEYRGADAMVLSSGMLGTPNVEMWVGGTDSPIDEATDELVCGVGTAVFGAAHVDTLTVNVDAGGQVVLNPDSASPQQLAVNWIGPAPTGQTGLVVASVDSAVNGEIGLKNGSNEVVGRFRNPAKLTMSVTATEQPKQFSAVCFWTPTVEGTFYVKFRVRQTSDADPPMPISYDWPSQYPVVVAPPIAVTDSEDNKMLALLNKRLEQIDGAGVTDEMTTALNYVRDRFTHIGISFSDAVAAATAVSEAWNSLLTYVATSWPSDHQTIDVPFAYYNDNPLRSAMQLAAALSRTADGTSTTMDDMSNPLPPDNKIFLTDVQAAQLNADVTSALGAQISSDGGSGLDNDAASQGQWSF